MEVEIKLRLADKAAHAKVAKALEASFIETHQQENFFFDSPKGDLSAQLKILRCRFYNVDKKCLVTFKGGQVITEGVVRGSEEEAPIDPAFGRDCVDHNPSRLLEAPLPFVQRVKEEMGLTSLKCLGGFHNVRSDYRWPHAAKLELDETRFEWGTVYEIEVETEEPEQLKGHLEDFLKEHGVEYKYNTTTKFHNFITKSLE